MDKNELIAQYLSKKLSQEAKKEFDHLMAIDVEFAKDVVFQENLKTVIKKEEHNIVKSQLQDFEAEEEHTTFNIKNWLVAASVIVLLGLSGFWYFNRSIDTEKLYAENFEPYRNIIQPIVRGEATNNIKTKAFVAYETKNHEEALSLFNIMLKEKHDVRILFYKANVLLQLNEEEQVITILSQNLKMSDSLIDKHQWYLALAYLKNNEIENAKNQLSDLIASNSTFKKDDAKQLLKKLK